MRWTLRAAYAAASIYLLLAMGSASAASSGVVAFTASTYSVSETAGSVTLTIARTGGSSGAASVSYKTLAGTAVYNVDYDGEHGVIDWADGDAAPKTIAIKILNSGDIATSKEFSVVLSAAVGATLGTISTAEISIFAPTSGTVAFSEPSYSVLRAKTTLTFSVARSGSAASAASVHFETKAGTAVYNVDYQGVNGVLSWAAGDATPKTFTVQIDDPNTTATRQFNVELFDPTGVALGAISSAPVSILAPSTVAFSAAGYSVVRASTNLTISVSRSGATTSAASVHFETKAGTAVYNVDYTGINGVLSWAAGDASAKSFTVHLDDPATSDIRSFSVLLFTPSGNAVLGSPATATVTITPPPPTVTVTASPATVHAISPYIYGMNGLTGTTGLTLDRAGGNRYTAYNWETNASNAGSDYLYENDAYLSSSTTPADPVVKLISADQAVGAATVVTFQMQGLVAGDENGPVSVANPPDLSRFKTVVYQKSSESSAPFTLTPPTTDAYVYMDEFAWALDKKFGGQNIFTAAPSTERVFAQLDNEPELWNSTHLEVQGPTEVSTSTYIAKTIALATALKTQFPTMLIFGPVHYGFYGIYAWNGELNPTPTGNNWFPDLYLPAIKSASATFGHPLVDVYDFHWYSEATDGSGNRVTGLNSASLTDAQVQAIVQSPRTLWDTTYSENSYIPETLGGPVYILGRLQSRIAAENPGMKLSITEYNNGGALHIAGTIAQADNLGIFGAQGLFAANLWPLVSSQPYLLAGFRAFRDFDGAGHNFGDTSVQATSSNIANVAAYVSTDSTRPGRVVIVAINRSTSAQVTAITGQPLSGTAHLYQMTAASAMSQSTIAPVAAGTQTVSGSSITVSLPPLSVTTIDTY